MFYCREHIYNIGMFDIVYIYIYVFYMNDILVLLHIFEYIPGSQNVFFNR